MGTYLSCILDSAEYRLYCLAHLLIGRPWGCYDAGHTLNHLRQHTGASAAEAVLVVTTAVVPSSMGMPCMLCCRVAAINCRGWSLDCAECGAWKPCSSPDALPCSCRLELNSAPQLACKQSTKCPNIAVRSCLGITSVKKSSVPCSNITAVQELKHGVPRWTHTDTVML